jgi:hypothetical protein
LKGVTLADPGCSLQCQRLQFIQVLGDFALGKLVGEMEVVGDDVQEAHGGEEHQPANDFVRRVADFNLHRVPVVLVNEEQRRASHREE